MRSHRLSRLLHRCGLVAALALLLALSAAPAVAHDHEGHQDHQADHDHEAHHDHHESHDHEDGHGHEAHHDHHGAMGHEAMDSAVAEAMATSKAAYLRNWDGAAQKIIALAEAMPADKYSWRPAEGVYSFAEVLTHVAGANYAILASLDMERPEGDLSEIAEKEAAVAALKASLDAARAHIEATTPDRVAGDIDLFGNQMKGADAMFISLGHLHEHLGQSIAYARMNGVVPPWSR